MSPCELFNYKLIRNIFSCPRGGAFSAISCPSWWGICRFLRAIKTNPHLYPGVGWVGVYFDCCISSNCDRKGQSYPVEYYLELVEEYSEGKIHKSEPKPGNGNINTVSYVNQARGNTRISRMEFVYDERARDCKCLLSYIWTCFLGCS